MTADVVRPYRGVSAEDRRAERRTRLKEACLDLIGQDGVADISIDAVCRTAGLTKRYFYESFADRDELFSEVMEDFFVDVRTEMLDALAGSEPDPRGRMHIIGRVLIEFLERDARRARLYVEAPGHPALRARRDQAYRTYTRLLLDTVPATDPGRDGQARELAALIVVAGVTEAATTWLRGGMEIDREGIVREITDIGVVALR
jgi:AcrR family transcriptional regulator